MPALLEGVEPFLDILQGIGQLAPLFKGVGEHDDSEQGYTILVGVQEVGMGLELVLKGFGALSEHNIVQPSTEV
jgi:alpha-D-ribose 1-methylphosphonate 5-triphosphate synthase subunit PhnH